MADWTRYLKTYLPLDYQRTAATDGRITLAVWRFGQGAHEAPGVLGFLMRRVHGVVDAFWTRGFVGAELPRSVPAGPGVTLHHAGRGVILHPAASIGSGVTLFHRVTVGVRGSGGPARIGDDCFLGAGSSILGEIVLGDGARVGAMALVLTDMPPQSTAVGVPAKITQRVR